MIALKNINWTLVGIGLGVVLLIAWRVGYFDDPDHDNQDKRVAQKITCVNNLKQIGLSFRIWAGDNNDQYPYNVSTNAGGTMELCAAGKDGFDANAYLHLQVMSNEFSTPRILICPQDPAKKAAADFGSLQSSNVTYRLRSGTNVIEANPREILAVCPVDGNILYCDGTVSDKAGNVPQDNPHAMRVR